MLAYIDNFRQIENFDNFENCRQNIDNFQKSEFNKLSIKVDNVYVIFIV